MHSTSLATLRQTQEFDTASQVVSGLAHDFNNLLMIIGASAEFLDKSMPRDDPRCEDVDVIRDATARAAELAQQLLSFGRLEEAEE